LIPTSRLDCGFSAAARIASPSRVNRKNANTMPSTIRVIAIIPTSCDDRYVEPYQAAGSNGVGNSLTMEPNRKLAVPLKMMSRPMNTTTAVSSLACGSRLIRRSSRRWIASPTTNENTSVSTNATQYGTPAWVSASAM